MDDFLGHSQFLIYNKSYHRARLAQLNASSCALAGTYEHELSPDQLWTLEAHPQRPGFYYVVNERYPKHRLATVIDKGVTKIFVYDGAYFEDQLFKFVSNDDGFYSITNAAYPEDWLTKHGGGEDSDVFLRKFGGGDDQLWRLVPRFQASKLNQVVFNYDNRQGSSPIGRELSVTTGVRRTHTSAISNTTTYKKSMSATLGLAIEGLGLDVSHAEECEKKLDSSLSQEVEQSWSETEKTSFIVPPGKNIKVVQKGVKFEGQIAADTCVLLTDIKVLESDSLQFDESE